MNLKISLFLAYNGDRTEIESIIADIADVLMDYGLGNSNDPESSLNSLIILQQLQEETFDLETEMTESLMVIMPVKEEKIV